MTKPVWTADITIDAAVARHAIAQQFPALRDAPIEPFGSGWDNAAFLVDRRIVFRFPRRRIAVRLIEREIALLPALAPHLPLSISAPTHVGVPGPAYPYPFAGYERIAGTTACAIELNDTDRGALAVPLALFLRALHATDPAGFIACGLPDDEIGRLDPEKRLRLARERLPALESEGVAAARAAFAWLERHPIERIADGARTIVHGDLYARHVVLDARRQPAGIIDWGDVHRGDPALDIALAHLMLPACAHAAFREAYGHIDDRTWRAARYRALYHAILEVDYGIRENDPAMRAIGAAALRLMQP